jgi:protein SCO1/2
MLKSAPRVNLSVSSPSRAGGSVANTNHRPPPSCRARAAACILTAAALAGAAAAADGPRTVALGGPFALIAPDGRTVTDADLRGRWLLLTFGYTFCPDVCPTTLAVVAEALDLLGADAERVRAVFVTVDPARDTPAAMGAYTAAFDRRILGLTGTQAQTDAAAAAWRVHHRTRATDADDRFYPVDHGTHLYVVDPDGAFARAVAHGESAATVAAVLRETMNRR